MHPLNADVMICRNESAVAREAAGRFVACAMRSIAERGQFAVAIPGGSSPRGMLEALVCNDLARLVPWEKTHIFFTDERCVPPDSDESNYRLANDLFLSRVRLPAGNIHRFLTEREPQQAAAEYEKTLLRVLRDRPQLDLVILGMGADTHTASLFPHSPVLEETQRLAVATHVEKLDSHRLTLTVPMLSGAREIVILAMGEEKAEALRDVLQGPINPTTHPVQAIQPVDGSLLWIVDQLAAQRL